MSAVLVYICDDQGIYSAKVTLFWFDPFPVRLGLFRTEAADTLSGGTVWSVLDLDRLPVALTGFTGLRLGGSGYLESYASRIPLALSRCARGSQVAR